MAESTITTGTPQKLCTPTDLGEKARQAITATLNPVVADTFALYVKTKNFHWHMSGSHYGEYHKMLDHQAEQILAMIDVLAERVRKIGGMTLHSIQEIGRLQRLRDDNDTFVAPKEMIRRLMDDNKQFATYLRAAHKVCSEHNDIATTSLLENFIDETERRVWFLFETQAE